ncbi:hypothetical protein SBRCBS47491_002604 [Sporothrix bragantina]|uniref:Telomere-associated protein Rif1 N-terminal domain-containing protein n=1 Tax=Sporothrix bragantina TaxID=671064 RepID=A0ABP0B855_9PEZI
MAAEAAPSRLLESLPARPPTPPREAQQAAAEAQRKQPLLAASRCDALDPRSSLHTPPSAQSLLSSATKTGSTGSRQKKVEFSARAEYKEAPIYAENAAGQRVHTTPPIVVLPPSSSASRPTKSILKATAYEAIPPSSATNISEMLASTVQQLIGADRDSKLDAYLMLSRALKTSDNLPDRIALQSKMSLFTQFMQRDITTSKTPEGALDSTLVIAALDLLNTFLRFSAIASTLSNDFGVFIIDHCIRSFEVSSVPRDVLRSLMRVVALQSFPAKVMTSDRVGRMVSALHNMDEQYESKNTIVMRSIIYRALVKNNKMLMTVHLDWLPDLLADMVSTVPHIREAAISLGLEASFALGRERPTSQRVIELLQATVDDERYLDYYANRLQAMTKNKAESASVPQVWSVVTLFLRTLEKWDFLMKWLHILQDCFNSSDYRTKEEANYAWSRFTYALLRNNRTLSKKMTTVLNQALVSQLRRRGSGKQADDFRKVVIGCICNLFYYAMRDTAQLDNIWDNVVKPVVLQLLELSSAGESTREKRKANLNSACAILTGLLDCSTTRPWKEDHIAKSPIVSPEDLPAIDVKWVRRNADRVFALVGPILEKNFLELSIPRSATQILWQSIVGAVSLAAAKEIKVSPDTAAFVGHAFSLILKIWTNGVPTPATIANVGASSGSIASTSQATDADNTFASTQFLAAAREFLLTMVDSLGCLPFTEKQLSKDERNTFVPVATPSQRAGKGHSVTRTPLRHLFSIISSLPPGVQDDEDFADFVESVFAPFFSAKSSQGRRALAFELIQMTPMEALCPYGPWKAVASRIASSLAPQTSSGGSVGNGSGSNGTKGSHANSMGNSYHYYQMSLSPGGGGGNTTPAGHEYREVVRVLERGLRSTPRLPWACWQSLFCTLCDRVREDAGEAGLALCVLEPLAKTIMDLRPHPVSPTLPAAASRAAVELIPLASHPRDRQAVEAAKRRLWGPAIASSGSLTLFDTFDSLYRLTSTVLHQTYVAYDSQNPESVEFASTLLKEVAGFFDRFNEQLSMKALAASQDGLADWVRDEETKLGRQSSILDSITLAFNSASMWFERVGSKNSTVSMVMLEPLLCAAFSSRHRYIVNNALSMWTRIYGNVGELDYPEKLKETLASLQTVVDVPIPGLDIAHVASGGAQQPMFIDSQDDQDAIITLSSTETNLADAETPRVTAKQHATPVQTPLSATSPSSVNRASLGSIKKKSKKDQLRRDKPKSTPPRPRHDDSQIEFTAIDFASALPSSSAISAKGNGVVEGSQILTERQREVRDRQRETNALYSDVMSSSPSREVANRLSVTAPLTVGPVRESSVTLPQQKLPHVLVRSSLDQEKQASSPPPEDVALPEQVHAATPEPVTVEAAAAKAKAGGAFAEEEFIASTPTPRRGQALVFPEANDNEIDSPSSPPEPRRYPLLPDISSRSRSSSILDEWQFSSSPLSGSPISARHTLPEPELSIDGVLQEGLAGHMEAQEAGDTAAHDDTPQGDESAVIAPLAASDPFVSKQKDSNDVVMEDANTPTPTAAVLPSTSSQGLLTVITSPLAHKKSKPPTSPSTPMQTRRRSALSQETSQESSQESPQETPRASRQLRASSSVGDVSFLGSIPVTAPQSLPRASRRSRRSTASCSVSQSSPLRTSSSRSSSHSIRHYKLIAMPSSSMQNVSFRMSDGEERSMLRLAVELDELKKQTPSQSSSARKNHGYRADSYIREDTDGLGCITVWTGDEQESKNDRAASVSSQDNSQRTPSQRSRRRKRKRSASARDAEDDTMDLVATSSPAERRIAQLKRHVSGTKADRIRKAASPPTSARSSSPASFPVESAEEPSQKSVEEFADTTAEAGPSSLDRNNITQDDELVLAPEDQEVQSQLALELEELSYRNANVDNVVDLTAIADTTITEVVEVQDETGPDSVVEVDVDESATRPAKKPRLAGILSMLKGSLALLQAATLSRDEVGQIEDVCMDVKRALYDAERRGRDD